MRFIIPNYALSDSFVENVAFTLREMGHEVITAPRPSSIIDHRVLHLLQQAYDAYAPNRLTHQEKWLLKTYRTIKPDVVLALTQSIREEILVQLQRDHIATISWWGDTAANMRKEGLLCKGWDLIFIKDKYAAFKLNTLGLPAHYLPEAMNPQWHKWNFTSIDASLLFAGSVYDYRHYLIRRLAEENFDIKLFGHGTPRWARPSVKAVFQKKYIIKEEKSLYFGTSLACINSTAMSEGNSVNCRAFEIAGAGGLQIMEYRQAIEDCFDPGKEIVTFSTFEELTDHIRRFQKDGDAAMKIRKAGFDRANAQHTYRHRLTSILFQLGYK